VTIAQFFADQLGREAAISHRVLGNVPEGRHDWKPHDKSMQLGYLATLVATMPMWIAMIVRQDSLDLQPKDGPSIRPEPWSTWADLQRQHEATVAQAREALQGTTDEHLATSWSLLVAEQPVLTAPRHVMIADTFTHLAHHRGQLSVYMRLLGAAVPSIYGPSADERSFG
jgi:uncharacterized damage-inducible protein DinB